jgi:cytochrome c553
MSFLVSSHGKVRLVRMQPYATGQVEPDAAAAGASTCAECHFVKGSHIGDEIGNPDKIIQRRRFPVYFRFR